MKTNTLATIGFLLATTALATSTFANSMPDDWLLPADFYVAAKMPMHLTHPRPEAADWSYAKNAHPGLRWEIPIVIQGGAWPFRYEIIDNGGAGGLAIGSELERVAEGGFIIHRMTESYGRLWWDSPQEGQYDIQLRVTDQELNSVAVDISLTVGTDGWVFVDADNGSDANAGTVDSPFKTLQRVHEGGEAFEDHRIYLAGTVAMDGNRDNGNLRIAQSGSEATPTPAVWLGWPGRNAVLEAYEGHIVLDHPDFYMANLEHRHHEDFFQDNDSYIHMITAWADTDRLVLHDVHFSRFQGDAANVNLGNSSIIMLTSPGQFRHNVAIVNNLISGESGIFTSTYYLKHAVFENNRARNANFVLQDNSTWSVFFIKKINEFITLRANRFDASNQWSTSGNLNGALGQKAARNIEYAWNTLKTPYTPTSSRGGALLLFDGGTAHYYSWTPDTPIWLYRNSLNQGLRYAGGNLDDMPDGTVSTERNISSPSVWPDHPHLVNTENLDLDDYLDADLKLTSEHRAQYLGRYGAEIAEPDVGLIYRDRFESTSQQNSH